MPASKKIYAAVAQVFANTCHRKMTVRERRLVYEIQMAMSNIFMNDNAAFHTQTFHNACFPHGVMTNDGPTYPLGAPNAR